MGRNAPHKIGLMLTLEAMRAVFAGRAKAIAGIPLELSDTNEPEPDVMVVASDLRSAPRVEDADASLRADQTTRAALYACHSVPEYLPDP